MFSSKLLIAFQATTSPGTRMDFQWKELFHLMWLIWIFCQFDSSCLLVKSDFGKPIPKLALENVNIFTMTCELKNIVRIKIEGLH